MSTADAAEAKGAQNDAHDDTEVAMTKIRCPRCNHRPFRNETGLKWHLEHIHGDLKPSSDFSQGPTRHKKLERDDPAGHEQNLLALKREIEEELDARLWVFTERDAWLSERMAKLERTIDNPER